jgi:uncharacterized protein (DUF1330 family)
MTIARRCLPVLMLAAATLLITACNSSSDQAPTPTIPPTPSTPLGRLTAAYNDPALDPSPAAWEALLADEGFDTQPVAIVEFVQLKDDPRARANYDAFVDTFGGALFDNGGLIISVNDTLMPGLEGLEGYRGGVSWVAEAPSLSAFVDTMLNPRVVRDNESRRAAITKAQLLVGPNLLPDLIKQLGPNEPASDFPSGRVQGKTTEQIVSELSAIYPSGGADPSTETLTAIADYEGFEAQRVHFINLYRFKADGGEVALSEYNAAALPVVLAHGGRPKVLANVTHHLIGPTSWDRFIFVSWPSLAVFTDLRLDPAYVEAQKSRVVSAEEYGNLITIARVDQDEATATP